MKVACPHCLCTLNVAERLRGQSRQCPGCRQYFNIPSDPKLDDDSSGDDSELSDEISTSKKTYSQSEMLGNAKRRIVEVTQQVICFITPIATRCWLAIRKGVLAGYEELKSTSQYYIDNRTLFADYILDLLGMQPPGNDVWLRPHHKSEIYHQNEVDWFVRLPDICAECGAEVDEQQIDRKLILHDVQKSLFCVIVCVGLGLILCLFFLPFWLIVPTCIISFWAGWRKRRESEGHVVYSQCHAHKNSKRYPKLRLFNAKRQSLIVTVGSRKTAQAFKQRLRGISLDDDQDSYSHLDRSTESPEPKPQSEPNLRGDNDTEFPELTLESESPIENSQDDFEFDELEIT